MTEHHHTLPGLPISVWRRRLRRFFLRHVPLAIGSIVLLVAVAVVGLYFWASSSTGEQLVRRKLVAELENGLGGRVEIASFHWNLLRLQADAGGVVIHGTEDPGEAPWVQIDNLRVHWSILGFWSPSLRFRDIEISHPSMHMIVYPDGSTNQPQPRKARNPSRSSLDTFFDLKTGQISVVEGIVDYEDRAAALDLQNRHEPIDLKANDFSLRMSYLPGAAGMLQFARLESYRIDAGATDLSLNRGAGRTAAPAVHGHFQATLDLERNAIYLRSLSLTAHTRHDPDRTLQVTGSLQDFAHPHWQARTSGDFDMRLLDPVFGYPFTPEGIAHLDLTADGQSGQLRIDGDVRIDEGSYIGTGVVATGVRLDARVHADKNQLLISQIVARLRQGGQLEGTVSLQPWLPFIPGTTTLEPQAIVHATSASPADRNATQSWTPPYSIPVNGKVSAEFKGVALDTILGMVSPAPFQRLGLDARLNGTATANWTKGDTNTVEVSALLGLSPSSVTAPSQVPTTGVVDATYFQRNGAVAVRKLEIHTPSTQLQAQGTLGAFPMTTSTALSVDFSSRNLGDLDTVLRDLGLRRNGKEGTAALPIALTGQGDFHGTWTGSLTAPRIAGDLKATQIDVELPPLSADKSTPAQTTHPQTTNQSVHIDSVEANGSYSASRIAIDHAHLLHGSSDLTLSGSLDAAPSKQPVFDEDSTLHLHLGASKVSVADLQPFIAQSLPLGGTLNARIDAAGPIRALGGSGSIELDGGSVYGEPVARLRAQGTVSDSVVHLASITASEFEGSLSGTGSYDLRSRKFQIDARGSGIDVSRIGWLEKQGMAATGKLAFTVAGSGTPEDPHLEGHATLSTLALGGEPLGNVVLVAHTAGRSLNYDVTSRLAGAELAINGHTTLQGDYPTQARLDFSHFNIDALLREAHVEGLNGESALAGQVTLDGPLARVDELHGEARLQELAVTIAQVHLKSEGQVHATLAGSRINLDPLHITGEQTDMRLQGGLNLKGTQQLDLAASGSVNLKLAETLDPDLTASGLTTFQVEAHGPLRNPNLQGRIDFQDGSMALEDLPNGLSQIHGSLAFNQNRLEVSQLTAMSGGGLLTVGGYLAYQHGLFADLSVTGNGIRIRTPQGISALADATLHLQGAQNNLLLGGNVLVTRFTVSPDLDIAALAGEASGAQTFPSPDAPSNHVRLDVHIASSPQLNFQNAFAKLAGDVDLRLRGTVASPSLLGRVSITEGSATIAGTRYDLQRGDIFFTNPIRIEPSIDLNATARVEDYDITLGLHGSPDKLAVTYRSDPPLPESDVVALLALGRTENQQRIYTQQQEQALANPTTDALLGGALNATVSSRVQKLFGAGSVKVDPNYLGLLGNSTSRIIVEEQLGRNLTLTYATNVDTTGQQLLQAEVAISRHVSVLVSRDESGVFSMVLKATRRYR
jgi:translocation and assembly module TamB